jgi:hypothetical protein
MNRISFDQSGSSSEDIPSDPSDRDKQREELARLIGRLLARHWLREQADLSNPVNDKLHHRRGERDSKGIPNKLGLNFCEIQNVKLLLVDRCAARHAAHGSLRTAT